VIDFTLFRKTSFELGKLLKAESHHTGITSKNNRKSPPKWKLICGFIQNSPGQNKLLRMNTRTDCRASVNSPVAFPIRNRLPSLLATRVPAVDFNHDNQPGSERIRNHSNKVHNKRISRNPLGMSQANEFLCDSCDQGFDNSCKSSSPK